MMTTDNYTVLFKDGKQVGVIKPGTVNPSDLIEGATVGSYIRITDKGKSIELQAGSVIPIKEAAKPRAKRAPAKKEAEDTIRG